MCKLHLQSGFQLGLLCCSEKEKGPQLFALQNPNDGCICHSISSVSQLV